MIADYFVFAVKGIVNRKVRSWLTLIGIFIGMMAVVALISLGQGLQDVVNQQFEQVGGNRIIITPGGGTEGIAAMAGSTFSAGKLTDDDVKTVKSVRGVEDAIGLYTTSLLADYRDDKKYVMVFCAPTDADSVSFYKQFNYMVVEEGRYLSSADRLNVIVGKTLSIDYFKKPVTRGSKITLEGTDFDVVGINKKAGNPVHDDKVTVPIDTCRDVLGTPQDQVSTIGVKVNDGFNVSAVAEDIKKELRRKHNVKEGQEDFNVQTAAQLIQSFLVILNVVQWALTGIALISLAVGCLGIMTTMYTSVLERTNQIGVMKAVGATRRDILMLFMIEAGMLGVVGGVIGAILGLGLSNIAAYVANIYLQDDLLKASMPPQLVIGVVLLSFFIGALSGLLPAWRAANLSPVEAIRSR